MIAGAMHLAETLNEAPAIIFVCGPVAYPPNAPLEQFVWSALYPAAQNLIVAARFRHDFHDLPHVYGKRATRTAGNSPGDKIRGYDPHWLAAERFREG
jgi:hypothetical protein